MRDSAIRSSKAVEACRGAFLVLGNAYSGSTLLNVLLGAHPEIAGGGELHWLAREAEVERALGPRTEKDGRCTFCGEACPVWTAEVRGSVRLENIYDVTARAFGRPFVCDATKTVDWSNIISHRTPTRLLRLMLVKHPLRLVSSFIEKARRFEYMNKYDDIEFVLKHLYNTNSSCAKSGVDYVIKYEDIVSDLRGALTPILSVFDLEYDRSIENWRSLRHHHVGGNSGPRTQIAPRIRPTGGFSMRKYNRPDIFMDDSFAEVLTQQEISQIVEHPTTRMLCERFGYDLDIAVASAGDSNSMDLEEAETSLRRPKSLLGPFEANGGFCHLARLELLRQHLFLHSVCDHKDAHRRSPIVVVEDGRRLGPPHSVHGDIRAKGEGRFSHWNEDLYFSASDGSDPNTNGRVYEIEIHSDRSS